MKTAKADGQEPDAWLRHVLERLPHTSSLKDYEALLPLELLAKDSILTVKPRLRKTEFMQRIESSYITGNEHLIDAGMLAQ